MIDFVKNYCFIMQLPFRHVDMSSYSNRFKCFFYYIVILAFILITLDVIVMNIVLFFSNISFIEARTCMNSNPADSEELFNYYIL